MSDTAPLPEPSPTETAPPRRIRVPADHYNSSPDEVKAVFPRWVPIGCGSAAAVLLVAGFVGGALLVRYGMGNLMAMLLDSMQTEVTGMYAKDVPQPQRKALDAELSRLRENVASEKLPVAKLDPVIKAIRDVSDDNSITAHEAGELTHTLRVLNDATARTPAPKPPAKP